MTKTKTLEQIENLLLSDFGIKHFSVFPVLQTTLDDSSETTGSALPSNYYRAEIEYENFSNNAYIIFSLFLNPIKNEEAYSYTKNTLNIINYSQNTKRIPTKPQFEIEIRENNIDEYFVTAYRQFHRNLENEKFENIFLEKDLQRLKLAFSELETILNKTKKARQQLMQEVDIKNELRSFSIQPQMYNELNMLDLQKALSLILEYRFVQKNEQKSSDWDLPTLSKIDWLRLYNTFTTKNIAISYLSKINFSVSNEINDEFLLSIYFTIIKDLNEDEEKIYKKTLNNLNIDSVILEESFLKKIEQIRKHQAKVYRQRKVERSEKQEASRKREYDIEYKSITNPSLRKTRDAILYIEILLRLISENNDVAQNINMQRSLGMYLRTKFARFKQDGYINNSKNGPRYTLESKGIDLLN